MTTETDVVAYPTLIDLVTSWFLNGSIAGQAASPKGARCHGSKLWYRDILVAKRFRDVHEHFGYEAVLVNSSSVAGKGVPGKMIACLNDNAFLVDVTMFFVPDPAATHLTTLHGHYAARIAKAVGNIRAKRWPSTRWGRPNSDAVNSYLYVVAEASSYAACFGLSKLETENATPDLVCLAYRLRYLKSHPDAILLRVSLDRMDEFRERLQHLAGGLQPVVAHARDWTLVHDSDAATLAMLTGMVEELLPLAEVKTYLPSVYDASLLD